MARVSLRTMANKSGFTYTAANTTIPYAEDFEAIKDALQDASAGINTQQVEVGGTTVINSSGVAQVSLGCVPTKDKKAGSDCTLTDGVVNRVLTLTNTVTTTTVMVGAGGRYLSEDDEYTVTHNAASSTITFLTEIWDDTQIEVTYFS